MKTLTSTLRIFEEQTAGLRLETAEHDEIARELEKVGVRFERWEANVPLDVTSDEAAIAAAYAAEIDRLKREGGYQSMDVIRLPKGTPDTDPMRRKFLSEHRHSEDEVRFFVQGAGAFYLHLNGAVYQAICTRGDLISVPAGTPHWFDMGPDPEFVAIRLFTNKEGWVADYTGDAIAERFPLFE
jgi:1,2-dihydroxy-3-keto-5-methylthiopentene dioxygenase